ncbi:MAG: hotdog domain-containing protein [Lautropia sp.]|nr:hotdog domain-containing protein [Lautropia sp.]
MTHHDHASHLMPEQPSADTREPILAVVAMPADLNPAGHVFGGWIMAQMDIGGSILALRLAKRRVSTVAANQVQFRAPLFKGDRVLLMGEIERVGSTSITVRLDIEAERLTPDGPIRVRNVASGQFVYVALDEHGKPHPISSAS